MNIDRLLQQRQSGATIPPVDQWRPALSGDINIVIQADGTWLHEGQPFARPDVARLLSSLLRHDPEGYCLVTPVERWCLQVDDLPFVAVEADFHEDAWWFTTQFEDVVRLDATHPLAFSETQGGEMLPEIAVRYGLSARLHRHVFYQLVDAASMKTLANGQCEVGVWSAGEWFPLGCVDAEDAAGGDNGAPSEAL
ncbi:MULTISPECIES: DUF1285 domain-containing protein [unclassified Halomonas]|uniref:DUF1285 domain-containing protein n=1 Tax=unclassified Halomonas TaxID=2609666 RepID=UPI0040340474